MPNERLDLSALDPTRHPIAFDATVRSIVAAAAARRAMVRLHRTALAAAAVIAMVALPTLILLDPPRSSATLAESSGIPRPIAAWVQSNHSPTAAELVAAVSSSRSRTTP
jgi:hypothetical protein